MQRVIVAYGDRVAMEPTLRQSLNTVMGEQVVQPRRRRALASMERAATAAQAAAPRQVEELERAKELIQEARSALQEGNFAQFGDRFNELEEVLNNVPVGDTTAAPVSTPPVPADTVAAATPADTMAAVEGSSP
jgi:uncharacterized membrane protein (UPF0182 family)